MATKAFVWGTTCIGVLSLIQQDWRFSFVQIQTGFPTQFATSGNRNSQRTIDFIIGEGQLGGLGRPRLLSSSRWWVVADPSQSSIHGSLDMRLGGVGVGFPLLIS